MGKAGFEPAMKSISRFTVCRFEPLSHFPTKNIYINYASIRYCLLPKLTRIFAVRQQSQTTSQPSSNELQDLAKTTQTVFSQSIQHTKDQCATHFQDTQNFLNMRTDVFNTHTNQAFQKYQTKKIQLNQTVKNTVHQLQTVLPITTSRPQYVDQAKTNQLVAQYLLNKMNPTKQKTK
jgi:ElaB/YqjD/DUF883 family membrane-anchored ribosome-binding protein